jgi:hypothetical protein
MSTSLSVTEILAKLEARIAHHPRLRVYLKRYPLGPPASSPAF